MHAGGIHHEPPMTRPRRIQSARSQHSASKVEPDYFGCEAGIDGVLVRVDEVETVLRRSCQQEGVQIRVQRGDFLAPLLSAVSVDTHEEKARPVISADHIGETVLTVELD